MSSSASSWLLVWSLSRVASIDSYSPNRSRIRCSSQPSAFSSTVTLCLRLRSIRTPTLSRLSISNSSHAPRGDHLAAVDILVRGLVDLAVEVDAGRADQLRDDNALGAVDDERALGGHQRE